MACANQQIISYDLPTISGMKKLKEKLKRELRKVGAHRAVMQKLTSPSPSFLSTDLAFCLVTHRAISV